MEANIGYIVTGGNQVDLTLPSNLAVGDIIRIRGGKQRTEWRILPGAEGQVIKGHEGIAAAGNRTWTALAVSDDGQRLAAAAYDGFVYTSSDGGVSWVERGSAGRRQWQSVSLSGDGTKLVAVPYDGYLQVSSDGGETWAERTGAGKGEGWTIASSTDGVRLVAATFADFNWQNGNGGFVYTSQDGGETWTRRDAAGEGYWRGVASSGDGLRLVGLRESSVSPNPIELLTSSDGGETWTTRAAPEGSGWYPYAGIASSGDGLKIISVIRSPSGAPSFLATSSDGGETWTKNTAAGEKQWKSVAVSSQGQTFYASEESSYDGWDSVYRSADSGVSWSHQFEAGELYSLRTNASGSVFYGIIGTFLFSSARTAFTEVKGPREIKLIYLGENTFGIE
jgi:hypothetical protein